MHGQPGKLPAAALRLHVLHESSDAQAGDVACEVSDLERERPRAGERESETSGTATSPRMTAITSPTSSSVRATCMGSEIARRQNDSTFEGAG